MHIDFFRLYTVNELPGSELEFPWQNILFPGGPCEPVISQAIAALGCMHSAHSKALSAPSSDKTARTEPYELYHKAVVALRRYIDRAPELGHAVASETALIAIMLLFCFEILCGSDHYAMRHLEAAFAILPKAQGQLEPSPHTPGTLVFGSRSASRVDVVLQLFLRMASDWLVSGPAYYGGCESPLQAICRDPMPNYFQSAREASIHLDSVCSDAIRHEDFIYDKADYARKSQQGEQNRTTSHECAHDCLVVATSRTLELDDECNFDLAVGATIAALLRWREAFAFLVSSQPRSKSVLLLEAQYLQALLSLYTLNDFDQTFCDSLEEDFRRAIDVAEIYLQQQSTVVCSANSVDRSLRSLSNLGNNLASTICMVIEKCRDSEIRRRGIGLLGCFNLRGIFDTPYLVAFYRHLVAEEEARARELHATMLVDLKCSDIPQQARFLEALMCSCDSEQEGEEFYRQNYGRMVYVTGHAGAFESGESAFPVCRGD